MKERKLRLKDNNHRFLLFCLFKSLYMYNGNLQTSPIYWDWNCSCFSCTKCTFDQLESFQEVFDL